MSETTNVFLLNRLERGKRKHVRAVERLAEAVETFIADSAEVPDIEQQINPLIDAYFNYQETLVAATSVAGPERRETEDGAP